MLCNPWEMEFCGCMRQVTQHRLPPEIPRKMPYLRKPDHQCKCGGGYTDSWSFPCGDLVIRFTGRRLVHRGNHARRKASVIYMAARFLFSSNAPMVSSLRRKSFHRSLEIAMLSALAVVTVFFLFQLSFGAFIGCQNGQRRGAVSSLDARCSQIGIDMIRKRGNAADAVCSDLSGHLQLES